MKERPILFSAPMVRAILEARKTQTRRVVKLQPKPHMTDCVPYLDDERFCFTGTQLSPDGVPLPIEEWEGGWPDCTSEFYCPHGKPGDRLWAKETFVRCGCIACVAAWPKKGPHSVTYVAGYRGPSGIALRPSIFMPRWASRITLEIADVRVQRLQDISEEDAHAEGALATDLSGAVFAGMNPQIFSYRRGFESLWESINAKKHPWSSNPWVWVITFKRVTA